MANLPFTMQDSHFDHCFVRVFRQIKLLVTLCGLALLAVAAQSASVEASLVSARSAVVPGESFWVGVQLKMKDGWHVYWRNPGESGYATSVEWDLPKGVKVGPLLWPIPAKYVDSGITTFIYEKEVILPCLIELDKGLAEGPVTLKGKVAWLECKDSCLPGSANVELGITVGKAAAPAPGEALIEKWQTQLPKAGGLVENVTVVLEPGAKPEVKRLSISGVALGTFVASDFLPFAQDAYQVLVPVVTPPAVKGRFQLAKELTKSGASWPATIEGILVQESAEGKYVAAQEVVLRIATAPAPSAAPAVGGAGQSRAAKPGIGSIWWMAMLAFLGGLILNVMPCVLPVIALKILGFVHQSKEAPERVRKLGLLYAVGVWASFMVLAGMVILVREGGGSASWGMQMQNPVFRLALLCIVLLVTLNLFGVFEVSLSGRAVGAAAGLASREGGVGAFFNGVLATALATPCTAPFLTVALGFAFTQPSWVIALVFTATALGLAAPYVALSYRPQWLRFLPRPGPWMQRFKVGMGFPMLATSVWLYDLCGGSFGEGGGLWLGLFLVVLAVVAWVWGQFVQGAEGRQARLGALTAVVLLAAGYGYFLENQLDWRHPAPPSRSSGEHQDTPDGIRWGDWSPEAVEAARASKRPVLVDFTAKWCLTCKANKKLAIDIPQVREKLKAIHAVALRADNTDPSPQITKELKRFGRAGVPLVVVFPADPSREPIVLPTLLSPGLVLEALDKASQPGGGS